MLDNEDYTEQPLVMFKQDDYHSDNEGDEDEIKIDASVMVGHQSADNKDKDDEVKQTPSCEQQEGTCPLNANCDPKTHEKVEMHMNSQTDGTLVTSGSSFVAKSEDQTDQDLGNNPSENANVKVDAQVETLVNTQTDSSTLVMSDSSFVAKSEDQIILQKMLM